MNNGEFKFSHMQIGIVFSPFNWRFEFENDKEWRRFVLEIGCFMITVGY